MSRILYLSLLAIQYGNSTEAGQKLREKARRALQYQLKQALPDVWKDIDGWNFACYGCIGRGYATRAEAAYAAAQTMWGEGIGE